jgi:hypothetical protein
MNHLLHITVTAVTKAERVRTLYPGFFGRTDLRVSKFFFYKTRAQSQQIYS